MKFEPGDRTVSPRYPDSNAPDGSGQLSHLPSLSLPAFDGEDDMLITVGSGNRTLAFPEGSALGVGFTSGSRLIASGVCGRVSHI